MTLDVGFLGYGFMGKAHANALDRLPMFFPHAPDVRRRVLVGRDESALADAVDELGFDRATTDWSGAIDEIDVLYNLGPNYMHVEPTLEAIEAGVHVLCEKPLAPDLDAAERMAAAANEHGVTALCAFNYRHVPAVRYAKRLIEKGEIGDVRHVRGQYLQDWLSDPDAPWSWRNDAELAGSGALGDLGSHAVDLARFLVGDVTGDIVDVAGRLTTFVDERPVPDGSTTRPVTVDDAFAATTSFENGAVGVFEGSRVARGHKNDLSVVVQGTAGSLRFSLERLNELELMRETDRGYQSILVTDDGDPYGDHWWPPGHVLGWEQTFVHENAAFLEAIRDDAPKRFEDGLRVQRILDAVSRSSATNRTVTPGLG